MFKITSTLITGIALLSSPQLYSKDNNSVKSDRRKAQAQTFLIIDASKRFETKYKQLPFKAKSEKDNIQTGPEVIAALSGSDRKINSIGIDFLNANPAKEAAGGKPQHSGLVTSLDGKQTLVDPWGNPFQIRYDVDGDGFILPPGSPAAEKVRAKIICWSLGPPSDPKKPASAKKNTAKELVGNWHTAPPKSQTSLMVSNLVNAIKLYEATYGVLPIGRAGAEDPMPSDAKFIDIMTGEDATQNPKQTVFFEGAPAKQPKGKLPARNGLVDQGNGSMSLVDPWGNPYMILLDADDDKELKIPGHKVPVRAVVVVWSYGPPKDPADHKSALKNDPKLWIKSWR